MFKRSDFKRYVEGIVINIITDLLKLLGAAVLGISVPTILVSLIVKNPAWALSTALAMTCMGLSLVVWAQKRKLNRQRMLLSEESYSLIDLGAKNLNWVWDHPDLPKGKIRLYNVPFNIKTDGQSNLAGVMVMPSESNELRSAEIQAEINRVEAVYVLLNTAFGLRVDPINKVEWEGRQIGAIRFTFRDSSTYDIPLILGQNIRDWASGNVRDAVFKHDDPASIEVWKSADEGSTFDMLQIELPNRPIDLVRISVLAQLGALHPVQPVGLFERGVQMIQAEDNEQVAFKLVSREVERSFPQIHIIAITCQNLKA